MQFDHEVGTVCELYEKAPALQAQAVHLVSTDEKTGIQALERKQPTLPMAPPFVSMMDWTPAAYN